MSDEAITCVDCGRNFFWTYSEQRYYKERGLSAPKRCPECRSRRRFDQASGGGAGWKPTTERDTPPRPTAQPIATERQPLARQGNGQFSTRSITYRYSVIAFSLVIAAAVVMRMAAPTLDVVACWLFAITAVTVLAYGYDKAIAGSGAIRVPEAVLLLLTLAGGTLGALAAMRYFRHKTAKAEFQAKLWLALAVQAAVIIGYVWVKTTLQSP